MPVRWPTRSPPARPLSAKQRAELAVLLRRDRPRTAGQADGRRGAADPMDDSTHRTDMQAAARQATPMPDDQQPPHRAWTAREIAEQLGILYASTLKVIEAEMAYRPGGDARDPGVGGRVAGADRPDRRADRPDHRATARPRRRTHLPLPAPRPGTARRAAAGRDRRRPRPFPTPEALASLAGAAPSTRQSGKSRVVGFRWAVDRQLRDALMEWAGDARLSSPWAADIYGRARTRGHDHPHAMGVLARAWVYVIWRCWQDGVAYDPARHGGAQRLCGPSSASAA